MEVFGIDLQRISLGALIIALGLLVDDAMITVETMVTRLEHGDDKEHAATFAYTSTAFPMLTGTLVTVAGFVPIGFARSAAGEYTFSIFAVVAIALIASWVVAVVFAPLLGVWILRKPKKAHSGEPGPIMRAFRGVLVLAMRARWATILLTLALFGASLYGMRLVPQQFFPASDRPELLVDLQLPENASIYATREASARLDRLLSGRPGRGPLEHLCRPGRRPVLPAPQRPAPERLLRPGRGRHQGPGAARAGEGAAGAGAGEPTSRAPSGASTRWSSARRSDGRCSTG